MLRCFLALLSLIPAARAQQLVTLPDAGAPLPSVPPQARLVLEENWGQGLRKDRWYSPRKKWGGGNYGVTRDNVRVERDVIDGREQPVVVCQANGDQYTGPVIGFEGKKTRVGGVIISREFFASGRFEVVMKLGSRSARPGGPADPFRLKGAVPAIWTFGYRFVKVPAERKNDFVRETPLYNPHMPAYGIAANEYWTELDFPEFGKAGEFERAMYNTFLQNQHEPLFFDVRRVLDGNYHTYTTEWRTRLVPLPGVRDTQVIEHAGFWWVQDKAIPFDRYFGNPLKRLGKDEYAVCAGDRADHYIDGKKVAENRRFVPAMAAQLTMGVWLPDWAGKAEWESATVSFGPIKVWQYDDPGDVRGVITESLPDNFDENGKPIPQK